MDHYEMLRRVSRTFALSIEQLPGILSETVALAYLLFRISDCIEDHETMPAKRKSELLRLWCSVLDGTQSPGALVEKMSDLDGNDPEVHVAMNTGYIMEKVNRLPEAVRHILIRHVRDTSEGMARWQDHGPFVESEEMMDDYMHEVAGRVGYLLTEVFAWYCPEIEKKKDELMPLARQFGLALQTVNVVRGIKKDYERGWVFIPVSFYEKQGLTRTSFFDPANMDKALQVVRRVTEKAENHLLSGLRYITLLPRRQYRIRLFCVWPLLFAVKTLALSRSNPDVLRAEAKITRGQVKRIVTVSRLISWSNTLLRLYYKRLSR